MIKRHHWSWFVRWSLAVASAVGTVLVIALRVSM